MCDVKGGCTCGKNDNSCADNGKEEISVDFAALLAERARREAEKKK